MRTLLVAGVAFVLASAGCKSNDQTSTSTTPTSPSKTAAAPTVSETWTNTLALGGSRFYSFNVGVYGTVNATLTSLVVNGAPSDAPLIGAIGAPAGTTCNPTTTANVQPATTPQLTGTFDPGIHCVLISDGGSLPGPGTFTIVIDHP